MTPIYFDNTLSYDERMALKADVETNLWDRIKAVVPWEINVAEQNEDQQGVDATYEFLKGGRAVTRQTIQLKMRESGGNDILMEMIRPWEGMRTVNDLKWNGRNSKIDVDKYFCVDTTNTLRIIDGRYLKGVAQEMVLNFIESYKFDHYLKSLKVYYGEVKIILEPSAEASYTMGKVEKLAVFILPSKIKINYQLNIG